MRRLLRYVGQPASLSRDSRAPRTGRYLDLTFRRGRSRVHGGAISARTRAARLTPCLVARVRRDQRLPVAARIRASAQPCARSDRSAQPGDTRGASFGCRPPVVFGPTVTRWKPGRRAGSPLTRGRARVSSRSSRQPAECRAIAHSPSAEGAPNSWSAERVHARSARSGLGARQRVTAARCARGKGSRSVRRGSREHETGRRRRGRDSPGRPKRAARREASCPRMPGKPARGPSR
jgi:hypothetical protein